jgi:hypothetical protein
MLKKKSGKVSRQTHLIVLGKAARRGALIGPPAGAALWFWQQALLRLCGSGGEKVLWPRWDFRHARRKCLNAFGIPNVLLREKIQVTVTLCDAPTIKSGATTASLSCTRPLPDLVDSHQCGAIEKFVLLH